MSDTVVGIHRKFKCQLLPYPYEVTIFKRESNFTNDVIMVMQEEKYPPNMVRTH